MRRNSKNLAEPISQPSIRGGHLSTSPPLSSPLPVCKRTMPMPREHAKEMVPLNGLVSVSAFVREFPCVGADKHVTSGLVEPVEGVRRRGRADVQYSSLWAARQQPRDKRHLNLSLNSLPGVLSTTRSKVLRLPV